MRPTLPLLLVLALIKTAPAGDLPTELAIQNTAFTLNSKPTFLLGCSYYAALGASEENIRKDLDDLQHHGFNWIRVFATWAAFDNDISAVDSAGKPRQPYLDKLQWLIKECDARGMVVDVTLARGDGTRSSPHLLGLEAHLQAVRTLLTALKARQNWFLDLSNERNIQDKRFTSIQDLRKLRDLLKSIDPHRLVTASRGGDVSPKDQARDVQEAGLDFICVHAERDEKSPSRTQARTKRILASFPNNSRVPLLYDEPFRRGYTTWDPAAQDFATDLAGAKAAGAAGWCFHNGSEQKTPDHRPARSFDLRRQRLFDQLDNEERKFLDTLKVPAGHKP